MKKNRLMWGLIALALIVVVGSGSLALASRPATSEVPPEQVVESFYAWYLAYPGQPPARNALADGAYASRPELAPEFVEKVDALLASFDKGGYDPFLCAQDVPAEVAVEAATVSGSEASVPVKTSFAGHGFTVKLALEDGQWRIVDITCRG